MPEEKYNGIFKDAADKIEFPFTEAAWSKMEEKLDSKEPAILFWNWKKISALVAAFLVGAILLVNYSDFKFGNEKLNQDLVAKSNENTKIQSNLENNKSNTNDRNKNETLLNRNESKKPLNGEVLTKNELKIKEGKLNDKDVLKNDLGKSKKTTKSLNDETKIEDINNSLTNNIIKSNPLSTKKNKSKQLKTETKINKSKDTFLLGEDLVIVKNNSINTKEFINDINNGSSESKEENENFPSITRIKESAKNDNNSFLAENNSNSTNQDSKFFSEFKESIPLFPIPLINPENEQKELSLKSNLIDNSTLKLKPIRKNRFAVLAMISPDFTYDKSFVSKYAGVNYGIAGEYYFLKNVSVSFGINRTMKKYHMDDKSSYKIDGWNNPYPFPAYDVAAKSMVLDVPITFKYYLLPSATGKLFVGAGISSYFLRTESYDFHFDTPAGIAKHHFNVTEKNNHYLSVFNFSLGFEKAIYKNLSFQIEPFLKVPNSGIGAGSLRLQTSGIFFSLKQRL